MDRVAELLREADSILARYQIEKRQYKEDPEDVKHENRENWEEVKNPADIKSGPLTRIKNRVKSVWRDSGN